MGDYQVYQVRLRTQTMRIARRHADLALRDMQALAKENATGGPYSTGNLARSIYKSGPFIVGWVASGSVGSRLSYAGGVEKGTPIHDIFPKLAPRVYRFGPVRRPALKFRWRGRIAYFNQIPGAPSTVGRSHPGQQGKHYLARALISVAARRNLRVIVRDL